MTPKKEKKKKVKKAGASLNSLMKNLAKPSAPEKPELDEGERHRTRRCATRHAPPATRYPLPATRRARRTAPCTHPSPHAKALSLTHPRTKPTLALQARATSVRATPALLSATTAR